MARSLADQLARAERQSHAAARRQGLLNRLGAVRVPMVPGVRVTGPLAGMESAAAADPAAGVIYARGGMDGFTAAHESAHLLERMMTDQDKRRFARAMGQAGAPWEVGHSGALGQESTGYRGSMAERFADMTAMVATRHDPEGNRVISAYLDDPPSRRELLRFGRSLERFGARHTLPRYVRPSRG